MKYCKKCNKTFADIHTFCSTCGTKLIVPDMTKEAVKLNKYVNKLFKNLDKETVSHFGNLNKGFHYHSGQYSIDDTNQIIFNNFINNNIPSFIKCETNFGYRCLDNKAVIDMTIHSTGIFKNLLRIDITIIATADSVKVAKQYDMNNSFKYLYNNYNEYIDSQIKIINQKIADCNESIKNLNEIKNMIESGD